MNIKRPRTVTFTARSDAEAVALAKSRLAGQFPADQGWIIFSARVTRRQGTQRTVEVVGQLVKE